MRRARTGFTTWLCVDPMDSVVKMGAVWAVALLVVCSGVRSYGEGVQATITQVRLATTTTTTEENPSATAAPAITTTSAGSDDTHSAVLSGNQLTSQDVPLVLVDLARADQERVSSRSATPPAAAPGAAPEDLYTSQFGEDESPAPSDDAVVPEGLELAEDETAGAAGEGEGHEVTGFPPIPETADNTVGSGYGVVTPQTADDTPGSGDSFAASEDAGGADEGHEVTGFPPIPESADNTVADSYGVVTPQTADDTPGFGESFAASEDAGGADEGHVVTGFPPIPETADNTVGSGYGVVTPQTADGTPGSGYSFAASEDAGGADEGHEVTGFPPIPETADNTVAAGYRVQSSGDEVDSDPDLSLAAAGGEDDGGFEVTDFPTEIGGEGERYEAYGDAAGDSLADFEGGRYSAVSSGGQLVDGYPALGRFSVDSSGGNPYGGVRPFGPQYGRP